MSAGVVTPGGVAAPAGASVVQCGADESTLPSFAVTSHAKAGVRAIFEADDGPRDLQLAGRVGWTLGLLARAGARGVTHAEHPGARLAAYVATLRHRYGVPIQTIREPHGGPFPGRHGRYVLGVPVAIAGGLSAQDAPAKAGG